MCEEVQLKPNSSVGAPITEKGVLEPSVVKYLEEQPGQRVEYVRAEIELIQSRLDKYDEIFWRNRGWMVAITTAATGWAVSTNERRLLWLAVAVPIVFWIHEVLTRWDYWHKYVQRYRVLLNSLNGKGQPRRKLKELELFDLGNHFGEQPGFREKLGDCMIKREPVWFHLVMVSLVGLAALVLT